ncbi:hypothetical protein [Poseidonibacter ostreae]|uniref:Uncharacterized protein n=1 Tax=Poseidonibacter ostreae TaxID=2654171 RepID=A0A6L4WX40_9BACT|nr:hypothetical protein [Poseidonibacter ostreae]KAB7891313.1 hypothetical protein GBG19_00320 [Poseidonibacter ostreae]
MENKYNLDDLPELNIKLGSNTQISPIVYNAMVNDLSKRTTNEFALALLVLLKDDVEPIRIILRHEVSQLKTFKQEDIVEKCVLLNKIHDFFLDSTTLDKVVVFSSLKSGLTETKASIHFREELSQLASILETIVVEFIDGFKDLEESDTLFDLINVNIFYLKGLSDKISNYSDKNLKKISNEFVTGLNFDEQVKILKHFMGGNTHNNQLLIGATVEKPSHEEEELLDAEIVPSDEAKKEEQEEEQKEEQREAKIDYINTAIEESLTAIIALSETTNSLLEENAKSAKEKEVLISKNEEMSKKITSLEYEIEKISTNTEKTFEMLSNFIARQTKITKIIEEKHNISFD